ncbi:MAG: DNA/RNA nuclease SfsA [Clostridiales bacterium]|nr:DNA/RNA nuclease SfsA [Clostridiales bacterium]
MTYDNIRRAVFLDRPNRFIANIEIDGKREVCHVKNTGRCRELLIPGTTTFVQDMGRGFSDAPNSRKTRYDLISVRKGQRLVNIDSSAPNKVFAEWVRAGGLFREVTLIRPEYRFGTSRFDFCIEADGRRCLIEVKGVTLEEEGISRFPDAPTERGLKHLRELISAVEAGYDAYAVFVVQMKGVRYLEPNWGTHPAFGEALEDARQAGVNVMAIDCIVTEKSITAADFVEVRTGSHRRERS